MGYLFWGLNQSEHESVSEVLQLVYGLGWDADPRVAVIQDGGSYLRLILVACASTISHPRHVWVFSQVYYLINFCDTLAICLFIVLQILAFVPSMCIWSQRYFFSGLTP